MNESVIDKAGSVPADCVGNGTSACATLNWFLYETQFHLAMQMGKDRLPGRGQMFAPLTEKLVPPSRKTWLRDLILNRV